MISTRYSVIKAGSNATPRFIVMDTDLNRPIWGGTYASLELAEHVCKSHNREYEKLLREGVIRKAADLGAVL